MLASMTTGFKVMNATTSCPDSFTICKIGVGFTGSSRCNILGEETIQCDVNPNFQATGESYQAIGAVAERNQVKLVQL
jgi:hypothetical protein